MSDQILDQEETEGCKGPQPEDYRLLITSSWEDIHHSRTQEWRALVAITGAHLVIFQAINYGYQRDALSGLVWPALVGGGIALAAAISGALMACRHRRLMRVKVRWIYRAEWFLGLVREKTEKVIADEEEKSVNRKNDGTDIPFDPKDKGIIPRDLKLETLRTWQGISWPRFLSTSWLILFLFALLGLLDVFTMVVFCK